MIVMMKLAQTLRQFATKKPMVLAAVGLLVLVIGAGAWYGSRFASTPAHLRRPAFAHYHFRTQLIVGGKAVDFSEDKFQQKYVGGTCSAELEARPIHFHDNVDQMTHIHWGGMTGGEFLKYYGWNLIGGSDMSLGWRFDQGLMMQDIPIFGQLLPDAPSDANFYVYTGDENGYEQKNWDDFLTQDLEKFFGKESNLGRSTQPGFDPLGWLLPKAYAHDDSAANGHEHDETVAGEEPSQEDLKRINNLIGNVVIFAQTDEPMDAQIKARFDNLVPLQNSTCGG